MAQSTQEEADKGFIVELLEENLSGDTRNVSIIGFEGALSSEARIEQLTVADSDGIWLTLTDVALQWNRAALFRGAIAVETLSAAEIIVARPPVPENNVPSAEAQPFSLPELPVNIDLGSLDIDRLELGEAFVGETLTLQIDGSASLGGGQGTFDLSANRIDDKDGAFQLAGSFVNATRTLTIDTILSEGPNGIVARTIGLPGRPAVSLSLEGDAPLDDFAASLSIATNEVERISGDFTLSQDEGGQDFTLNIGGDVTTLFAPDYREFFGPNVELIAKGNAPGSGGFAISDLSLSAQALDLQGQLDIGADGFPTSFDLIGTMATDTGDAVLLPLAGPKSFVQSADLSVQFDASRSDEWTAEIDARGFERQGLGVASLGLRGGGIIRAATRDVTANLEYAADGLEFDSGATNDAIGDRISGQLRLIAEGGAPIQVEELSLAGAGIDVTALATIRTDDDGFSIESALLADVEDLRRFAPLIDIELAGSGDLDIRLSAEPLNGLYDVTVSGETRDLGFGIDQLDPLLVGASTITTSAIRDQDGTRLEGLQIATNEVELTAEAELTNEGGRGDFSLSLDDLAKVEPSLTGPAKLDGTATLKADGSVDADTVLTAGTDQLTLGATSTPTPDGRTLIADLGFGLSDIARFADLAQRDIKGGLDGSGNFVLLGDQTRFTTELDVLSTDLTVDVPQLDPLLSGPGEWSLAVARTGDTRFRLSNLSGKTPWLELAATGEGDWEGAARADLSIGLPTASRIAPQLPGSLNLTANLDRNADLTTQVKADLLGQGTKLDLDLQVAAPSDRYLGTGRAQLDVANLAPFSALASRSLAGGVSATLTGSATPDLTEIDAKLEAQSSNLSIGNSAVDQILQGVGRYAASLSRREDVVIVPEFEIATPQLTTAGRLSANGPTGDADFTARLANIGLFTDQLSGPVTASGTAQREAGLWRVDIGATGPGGITANVDGSVSDDLRLNLGANGSAPLGLANDAIDPRRISGVARYDLRVVGPPTITSVSGLISTRNARLAVPTLVQALEGINADIQLNSGQAQVSAEAQVQSGGTVAITGPVGLSAPFAADLTARLRGLQLRDPELYETRLSGTFGVAGPLAGGARVSGDVTVFETEVRVPSSGIGALGDLPDVTHFGAPANVNRTLARAGAQASAASTTSNSSGPAFPIDVTVNAPSRIFVRGRGLDAELGGRLVLGGTTQSIVPNGQFNLIRGRLDILQQRFQLSEGSVSLQGDFEPYVRLVARTQAATGTTIQIIVEGPATAPEVRFVSSPELPQDEVLAQLIFGRNLSEISPLQAVQLASAIGTLAGRGGTGIIDGFRQNLNLDDFDVTTDEAGNAAVRAGAYLSENVYTDVTVSSDGSTEINLNLDITDEITARGSVDNDGETSVGIFFQRDY